jgi:predicted acyl esterase
MHCSSVACSGVRFVARNCKLPDIDNLGSSCGDLRTQPPNSSASLQVAALKDSPKALKGVISVCATDSRYDDDMHYQGGALLCENLSWSSWLLHTLSQPPDPAAVGDSWRGAWAQRSSRAAPRGWNTPRRTRTGRRAA